MPIKVHVKGKRKAPLPPTKSPERTAAAPEPQNGIENGSPQLRNSTDLKARKKLAPTPPRDDVVANYSPLSEDRLNPSHSNIMTPNNLSGCSSPGKLARKKYEGNIFFNIIGASSSSDKCVVKDFAQSPKLDKGEPVLKNYRSNMDLFEEVMDSKQKNDAEKVPDEENSFEKVVHRNLLVWNCQYCTLENPFWKIVCAVCDNMKPYDLPTTSTQTETLNLEAARPDDSNEKDQENDNLGVNSTANNTLVSPNGETKYENTYDEIYSTSGNENAVEPEVQPYAVDVVYRKKVNNKDVDNAIKRNSEIMIKDYPTNTLEMEKQRLRAVIRSMNNRALAEKYPVQTRNAVSMNNGNSSRKTPEYEAIDDFVDEVTNTGAIRKTDVKNNLQKLEVKSPVLDVRERNIFTAEPPVTDVNDGKGKIIEIIPPQPVYWNKIGNIDSNSSVLDVRDRGTKVSTSVQTEIPIKALPGTSAGLFKLELQPEPKPEAKPENTIYSKSKDTPLTENAFGTLNLPDACYEYIGNLSMYGDQDVFTNTLKKLENAFSDRKNEATFVEMNVSNLKVSVNVPKVTAPPEESIL